MQRERRFDFKRYLGAGVRQGSEIRRKNDANHGRFRSPNRLYLHREHGRQIPHDWIPAISGIGGGVDLSAAGAEVYAALVERVDGHGVAQDVDVAVALRQAFSERLPFVAAGAAAEDAQLALVHVVLGVALDGNNIDGLGFVGVNVDDEAEVGGQVAADFLPGFARVVASHDVPVFLHEENARPRGIHGYVVNAVPDLGGWVWNVFRIEAAIDGLPGFAAVVGTECAGGRDGDPDTLRVAGIENNRVQAHAARTRLPHGSGAVAAQAGEFLPVFAAIGGAEQCGIFHAGVDRVGIGERWLQMPYAFELPGMLRAVVPLVRGELLAGCVRGVVDELVAGRRGRTGSGQFSRRCTGLMPGFAAVVGALDQLAKPAAGLRCVKAIRIGGRALQMINLPAGKVRTADLPPLALSI